MSGIQNQSTPTRVFLSYARGDDEPFVKRLHTDLTKAGFTVWFDRESLRSRGITFPQEIKDAILKETDRLIYVGGPKAALSDYVRAEWQFALGCDHVVTTPILRLGDYDHVPGELSLLHCDDFRDDAKYRYALAKLIANLRQPNPKLGALFAVPSLPPNFLGRPDLMRRVRDALLVDLQKPQVIMGADARVGMQGMGGIGKSVLAAALARNRQVRQSYPDGVVWIACGHKLADDDLLKRQRDLARHLGGDENFLSLEQGKDVLRELLAAKAAMLVLDDVWRAADAQAFDVLGPRCRMLVTTRDKGILDAVDGELVQVSLFTEPEAMQLLAEVVHLAPAALPAEAHEVARECGYLPLALALCGGMAKSGHAWPEIVAALRDADLEWPENREAVEQHRTIWNAMKVSYDVLLEHEKARFVELAAFETDQTVPEAAAATLWRFTGQVSARNTSKLLIHLFARSLIQLDQKTDAGGQVHRRFRLHDLLYDFARRIAGAPRLLHQKILDAYAKNRADGRPGQTQGGGWHTIPADGYIHGHLDWHLEQAGDIEGLHKLLREETADGGNGWFEANERLGQPRNFEESVRRAWNLTPEDTDDGVSVTLGRKCRYDLITSSLNSLRQSIPPILQQALLRQGMWSVQQALACAKLTGGAEERINALTAIIPLIAPAEREPLLAEALMYIGSITDEVIRCSALATLLPYLTKGSLTEALAIVRAIRHETSRCRLLALVAQLPEPERRVLLAEELATARSIESESSRVFAMTMLAAQLPKREGSTITRQALAIARHIAEDDGRSTALAAVASQLPKRKRLAVLREALTAARHAAHPYYYGGGTTVYRADALVYLAPQLPSSMMIEAFPATLAIVDEGYRSELLARLAPRLPRRLLDKALAAGRACENGKNRSRALAALAVRLPQPERTVVLHEALVGISIIKDEDGRCSALIALLPGLPQTLLAGAVTQVRNFEGTAFRFRLLAAIAPLSPEIGRPAVLAEALAAARAIKYKWERSVALATLAAQVPEPQRPAVLKEALAVARVIGDQNDCSAALIALAPELDEREGNVALAEALRLARTIEDPEHRARVLVDLAPRLPDSERPAVLTDALTAARSIGHEGDRSAILVAIAPQLPPRLLQEATLVARTIQDQDNRYRAITALAPFFTGPERFDVLAEALTAARAIGAADTRAYALAALATELPEKDRRDLLAEAFMAACAVSNEEFRRYALVRLMPRLPPELLGEALKAAQAFEWDRYGNEVLAALSVRLPAGLLAQAIEWAQSIENLERRCLAIAALAPGLPEPKRRSALAKVLTATRAAARVFGRQLDRADLLVKLAPHLPPELLPEALSNARTVADHKARARALVAIAPRLPESERTTVFAEALTAFRAINGEWERLKLLVAMAPQLPPPLRSDALTTARTIANPAHRATALTALARHSPEPDRSMVLAEALSATCATGGNECTSLLVELAGLLPTELMAKALVAACACENQSDRYHASALSALVRRMVSLPARELAQLWTIPLFARRSRSSLLIELRRFTPVLVAVAGPKAQLELSEVARAISDVARWWP